MDTCPFFGLLIPLFRTSGPPYQWRIQDFQEMGEAPTYNFARLSQKLHEIKKIRGPWGGKGIRHCYVMDKTLRGMNVFAEIKPENTNLHEWRKGAACRRSKVPPVKDQRCRPSKIKGAAHQRSKVPPVKDQRSAGVTPEVNVRELVTCTPSPSMNKVDHHTFETQRRCHQKSKTGVSVAPQKGLMSSKII